MEPLFPYLWLIYNNWLGFKRGKHYLQCSHGRMPLSSHWNGYGIGSLLYSTTRLRIGLALFDQGPVLKLSFV